MRCGCTGEENEDETAVRVLGLRPSEELKQAEDWRKKFVQEEEKEFGEGRDEAEVAAEVEDEVTAESDNIQLEAEWGSD